MILSPAALSTAMFGPRRAAKLARAFYFALENAWLRRLLQGCPLDDVAKHHSSYHRHPGRRNPACVRLQRSNHW